MELCVADQFVCTLGRWKQRFVFLANLLKKSSYDNLFDLHPPLGESKGEREVFQIDGNFGAASGIASMLLRSCYGMIELLPALPDAWKSGRMEGLLAEGGVEVSIEWKDHQLVLAVLKSCVSQEIEVRCCGQKWKIHLQENEEKVIKDKERVRFSEANSFFIQRGTNAVCVMKDWGDGSVSWG